MFISMGHRHREAQKVSQNEKADNLIQHNILDKLFYFTVFQFCNIFLCLFPKLSGKIKVKEQFFVYDGHTMIADVGGYLGLLLGQSILSVYKYLAPRIYRGITRARYGRGRETSKTDLRSKV